MALCCAFCGVRRAAVRRQGLSRGTRPLMYWLGRTRPIAVGAGPHPTASLTAGEERKSFDRALIGHCGSALRDKASRKLQPHVLELTRMPHRCGGARARELAHARARSRLLEPSFLERASEWASELGRALPYRSARTAGTACGVPCLPTPRTRTRTGTRAQRRFGRAGESSG